MSHPDDSRAGSERRPEDRRAGTRAAGSISRGPPVRHGQPACRRRHRVGPQRGLDRRRNVLLAQHHRGQGWSIAQIANLLDRAPATVRGYLHDPTGTRAKTRKAGYAGSCERCGAPTSGADGKGGAARQCQRGKPQSRARWTREAVCGAHRFWRERFGFIATSVDWSAPHERHRGGEVLERHRSARWPSQSVVRRLYRSPAAARPTRSGPRRRPRPRTGGRRPSPANGA